MMNPVPRPADDRVLDPPPPKKLSKGSAWTRWTTSVCTVTTAGATFATASVMAVRRDAATVVLRGGSLARATCAPELEGEPVQAAAPTATRTE